MIRYLSAASLNVLPFLIGSTASAQTPAQNDSAAAKAKRDNSLPLIPTRTLEFTTNEGSWISLDVSPDGQTIVFELLGDLYTLPTERFPQFGGRMRTLAAVAVLLLVAAC